MKHSSSAEAFFAFMVESLIAKRKCLLAKDKEATPRDILTLLLEAQDPQTGAGLCDTEVKANMLHGSGKRAFIAGFVDGLEAPLTLFAWNTRLYSKTQGAFSQKKAWESATCYIREGFEAQRNDLRQCRERISQR